MIYWEGFFPAFALGSRQGARASALFACAVLLSVGSSAARADNVLQAYLEQTLAAVRNREQIPALAALVQVNGKVVAEAAMGNRALGHPESVTLDDRWQIGSDTKAFTATLIGTLVDQRVLAFDDTLETSLPALAKTMHPAYRHVTIRQLLSHTAGLPPLTNPTELPAALAVVKSVQGLSAQRMTIAGSYLSKPPASAAGAFVYSNLGYIIAGAIAEAHTGKTWESLLRERVFEPLHIRNVGFGPPGHSGKYDQPLPHGGSEGRTPLDPADPDSDNPPWLGPAGTINIGLRDWALFAQDQLDGALGHGRLLQQATYRALQTPVTENYAMGWLAFVNPEGKVKLLTHEGSNGAWFALISVYPKHDTIILTVTNFGRDAGRSSIEELGKSLWSRLNVADKQ